MPTEHFILAKVGFYLCMLDLRVFITALHFNKSSAFCITINNLISDY